MTDEQIIEAAGICKTGNCTGCPYHELYTGGCVDELIKDAFHLIIRQKAEIKSLRWHAEGLNNRTRTLNDTNKILTNSQETYIKNKIREFTERER